MGSEVDVPLLTHVHAVDDEAACDDSDIADGDGFVTIDLAIVGKGFKGDGAAGTLGHKGTVDDIARDGGGGDAAGDTDETDVDDAGARIGVDIAHRRRVDAVDLLDSIHQHVASGVDATADNVHGIASHQVVEQRARRVSEDSGGRVVSAPTELDAYA